jgi:hypothetical protein
MFRKNQKLGSHSRPQPHGKDKPAMLTQLRKQCAKPKRAKVEREFYRSVRPYQQSYKSLGTFVEIVLRLRGVVHVICAQNAVALDDRKKAKSSSHDTSAGRSYKF